MLGLINDILDFSKIEAGEMELDNHPFELREMIENALDLVVVQAPLDLGYLVDGQVAGAV